LPLPNLLSLASQPVQLPAVVSTLDHNSLEPSSSKALGVAALRYLDALRGLSKSAHGPCIDITYDIKGLSADVPASNSGISNVGRCYASNSFQGLFAHRHLFH